jgi:hypothetical protein
MIVDLERHEGMLYWFAVPSVHCNASRLVSLWLTRGSASTDSSLLGCSRLFLMKRTYAGELKHSKPNLIQLVVNRAVPAICGSSMPS